MFKFGPGACRCDKAEDFCIDIEGTAYLFKNDWQQTNENEISLFSPVSGGITIRFEKAGNGQKTLQ